MSTVSALQSAFASCPAGRVCILNANGDQIWSSLAPYIAAVLALVAALAAAWISHSSTVSGFRQGWINALRDDLAEYVGAAERWFRMWADLNEEDLSTKEKIEREQVFPQSNAARVLLWRIRLQFNPRPNQYKAEEERFLASLLDLIDPGKFPPDGRELAWRRKADETVEQGREILKRNWETTKVFPFLRWLILAGTMIIVLFVAFSIYFLL